jgi:orotidine-5'-phosphate decarboxylase
MSESLLSTKPIPPRERLIVALDLPSADEARRLVSQLGDSVVFYKLGLELFAGGEGMALADELAGQGKRLFLDWKLFDIPATVAAAVRQLRERDVFITVHGNDGILEAACREKGRARILAVTALTSLDKGDLEEMGFHCDVRELVLSRARRALRLGCDGVISSGLEARAIRADLGDQLLVVTPGIRPLENREENDQKRIMTPEEAFRSGADHIVVGRPVRAADDPRAAAEAIQATISQLFARG